MKLVRLLLLLGVILAAAGCTGWRRTSLPPPAPDAPLALGTARVTTLDGHTLAMDPVVVTAVHRSQVQVLESRGIDPWKTGGAAVLTLLVTFAAAVWVAVSSMTI